MTQLYLIEFNQSAVPCKTSNVKVIVDRSKEAE